jgi:hypothetical protein
LFIRVKWAVIQKANTSCSSSEGSPSPRPAIGTFDFSIDLAESSWPSRIAAELFAQASNKASLATTKAPTSRCPHVPLKPRRAASAPLTEQSGRAQVLVILSRPHGPGSPDRRVLNPPNQDLVNGQLLLPSPEPPLPAPPIGRLLPANNEGAAAHACGSLVCPGRGPPDYPGITVVRERVHPQCLEHPQDRAGTAPALFTSLRKGSLLKESVDLPS